MAQEAGTVGENKASTPFWKIILNNAENTDFYLFFILMLGILASVCGIILLKKILYYKYIDKEHEMTLFDYWQDFDGDWLTNEVDYEQIVASADGIDQNEVIVQIRMIKVLKIIGIVSAVALVFLIILEKVFIES